MLLYFPGLSSAIGVISGTPPSAGDAPQRPVLLRQRLPSSNAPAARFKLTPAATTAKKPGRARIICWVTKTLSPYPAARSTAHGERRRCIAPKALFEERRLIKP